MVMYMGKYVEHSIIEKHKTNREILNQIFEHALGLRPRAEVSYRPYRKDEFTHMSQKPGVDFGKAYPDFCEGDYAYISAYLYGSHEREMLINIRECDTAELWFNGEKQSFIPGPNNTLDTYVNFKKGENRLILKATALKEDFRAYIFPLVPKLRYGSGGDYAYCTWQYIKKSGYNLQEQLEFSRLYKKDEKEPLHDEIEWVYPVVPEQSNVKTFDFSKLCENGRTAYAYTFVKGKISIEHKNPLKIFANGIETYSENSGIFEKNYSEFTPILIKSTRADGWGFTATTDGEHSMPVVESADTPDLQWLWIGGFGREIPYGPEKGVQFVKPYTSAFGDVYWNFYRENTSLRQYLHSAFFGKWFYAIMVGHYGMKLAAEKLGKYEFNQYFSDSMKNLCHHRQYGAFDNKRYGYASYLASGDKDNHLDPIGTTGVNVAEYYMMSNDPEARATLDYFANAVKNKIPRFPDRTFYRVKTMWTDDTYMCLPLMARLGGLTGDESWYDDILTQVRGFCDRLYMDDKNLFSHIFFVEENKANRVPWCRGNGWVLLALSEVLLNIPETYHGYDEILGVYKKFAKGVLSFRDKELGFWHQVIDNPESFIETSGSAMFITALARGISKGWISAEHKNDVSEAWDSLCENCIDENGNVFGICMGSGCNMEEKYYLNLRTIENDDHGVGVVLSAGVEVMNMLGE